MPKLKKSRRGGSRIGSGHPGGPNPRLDQTPLFQDPPLSFKRQRVSNCSIADESAASCSSSVNPLISDASAPAGAPATPKKVGRPKNSPGVGSPLTLFRQLVSQSQGLQNVLVAPNMSDGFVRYTLLSRNFKKIDLSIHIDRVVLVTIETLPAKLPDEIWTASEWPEVKKIVSYLQDCTICSGLKTHQLVFSQKHITVDESIVSYFPNKEGQKYPLGISFQSTEKHWHWRSLECSGFVTATLRCNSCEKVYNAIHHKTNLKIFSTNISPTEISETEMGRILAILGNKTTEKLLYDLFTRKKKRGQVYPSSILLFAINLYSYGGKSTYKMVRQTFSDFLPSLSTLRRKIRKIKSVPGINIPAIKSFVDATAEPGVGICLSFDEIYFTGGLQIIRAGSEYITIGCTTCGSWNLDDSEPALTGTSSPEAETTIHRYLLDPETHHPSPILPPHVMSQRLAPESTPNKFSWDDSQCQEILQKWERSQDIAKIGLHFILSTFSSRSKPVCQNIGYIEARSVTCEQLHAAIHFIIKNVNQLGNRIETYQSVEESKLQLPSTFWKGSAEFKLNSNYPLALPATTLNLSKQSISAIVFDGSSHARSWSLAVGKSPDYSRLGTLQFSHPSQTSPILLIGDIVHLVKRIRNAAFSDKPLFFAPSQKKILELFSKAKEEINLNHSQSLSCEKFWSYHSSRISVSEWKALHTSEQDLPIRLSRIPRSALELTSKTKMSWPLATSVLNFRVALGFTRLYESKSDSVERKRFKNASTICLFVSRLLEIVRGKCYLESEKDRQDYALALLGLQQSLLDWESRNRLYHSKLIELDQVLSGRGSSINPSRFLPKNGKKGFFGGFHNLLFNDLLSTLSGISTLILRSPSVCPRYVSSDCVESFFSTVRSVAAGGALTISSHRSSVRRALLCKLVLFSYIQEEDIRDSTLGSFLTEPIRIIPTDESVQLDNQTKVVIQYIGGWLLHVLIRHNPRFPYQQLYAIDYVEGQLVQINQLFQDFITKLVKRSFSFFNAANSTHRLFYKDPRLHRILVSSLTASPLLNLEIPQEDYVFCLEKFSSMILKDYFLKHELLSEKGKSSFRASLPNAIKIQWDDDEDDDENDDHFHHHV